MAQLLRIIVKRFRGGLVFKAHRLLHFSTLDSRVIRKKKKCGDVGAAPCRSQSYTTSFSIKKTSGHEVYYTPSSLLVTLKYSCSKLHCQKFFKLKSSSYKIDAACSYLLPRSAFNSIAVSSHETQDTRISRLSIQSHTLNIASRPTPCTLALRVLRGTRRARPATGHSGKARDFTRRTKRSG